MDNMNRLNLNSKNYTTSSSSQRKKISQPESFINFDMMEEVDENDFEENVSLFDDEEEEFREENSEEEEEMVEVNIFESQDTIGINKKIYHKLTKQKINKSTRSCIFCQEDFVQNHIIRILPCKHYFHNTCLKPWFKKNSICPMCRFDVKTYFEDD
jgi:hypothetical protein